MRGMWNLRGTRVVHKEFWRKNLMVRDHLEDPGVDCRIILRWILKKWDREAWTGLLWLRIGTGVRRL